MVVLPTEVIGDEKWLKEDFHRFGATTRRRHNQSTRSFLQPARLPMRLSIRLFRLLPTRPTDDWHSVAVCSDGSYGVEKGLISSFPMRVRGGKWEIVQGLPINEFSRGKIDASMAELKEEKSLVSELLS